MWMKDYNSRNALASLPYEDTPKPRLPVTEGSIGRNDTARLLVDSRLKRRRFIVRSPYGRVEDSSYWLESLASGHKSL